MVYITGYGLLSSLPEDEKAIWHMFNHADEHIKDVVNAQKFAPFFCHPLTPYPVEMQIPNHSDRRAMDTSMQAAVYTAGKALEMAQLKQETEQLADTDIIICFSGGGRDEAVDQEILQSCSAAHDTGNLLNEKLMKNVRPTLFLGQLPNLLAANIAIVHGTTGYSLTLMGEEMGGAQAIQIACQRIQSGKAKRVLVGGVSVNDTIENMLHFASAKLLLSDTFLPIWDRQAGGICLGSGSGFLVLESEESALERKIKPLAQLSQLYLGTHLPSFEIFPSQMAVLSSVSAYPSHLQQEKELWNRDYIWVRAPNTLTGTLLAGAFPTHIIFAVQSLQRKQLCAPLPSASNIEKAYPESRELNQIWIHSQGYLFGHALACLESV